MRDKSRRFRYRESVRDLPRCEVCRFRHDPPQCREPGFPPTVKFLGVTPRGVQMWDVGSKTVYPRRSPQPRSRT